jgi:integrase/recombinase XerC
MKLNEAITVFTGDYSPNTARTYRNGLNRFLGWARETGIPIVSISDLDPKWVIPFARALKREGLSPRSIGVYLTAIVQFLHWMKREKVSGISAEKLFDLREQVKNWNRKNTAHTLPRLPKENAVVATIETAHEMDTDDERLRLYHLRNAALIETLASTGCRIGEAANLKRADLVTDQMAAWVRGGKGRKDRMIVFDSEESWDTVQAYLTERDKERLMIIGEEPLFGRHDKIAHGRGELMGLTTSSMRAAWRKMLERAGADHFTPHQLRHRAGTELLRKTGNLAIVQKYLGHADIGTTANTYTHLSNEDLIEAVRGG